jgi:hypothetical protein
MFSHKQSTPFMFETSIPSIETLSPLLSAARIVKLKKLTRKKQCFAQEHVLPLHGATEQCCENAVEKPGRARSVAVPMLFFAQSIHGIEPGGAARGGVAGE